MTDDRRGFLAGGIPAGPVEILITEASEKHVTVTPTLADDPVTLTCRYANEGSLGTLRLMKIENCDTSIAPPARLPKC